MTWTTLHSHERHNGTMGCEASGRSPFSQAPAMRTCDGTSHACASTTRTPDSPAERSSTTRPSVLFVLPPSPSLSRRLRCTVC